MTWSDKDDSPKAKGRTSKSLIKCLDCRAFIGDVIFNRITYCPFCDGQSWSIDND